MPQAHSYMRFSSMPQKKGDSLRRQTELRDAWLKRHPGVPLNKDLVAMGKSAFKGKHRSDIEGLKAFADAIENNEVQRGDYLLIENLDRLSREEAHVALKHFLAMLEAGVVIVSLDPEKEFRQDRLDMFDLMWAIMQMARANEESKRKSGLSKSAWKKKHDKQKEDGKPITARIPAWLELVGAVREEGRHVDYSKAEYVVKRGARSTIRRIFEMCIGGDGPKLIARKLREDGTPTFGEGKWHNRYIRRILTWEAVKGKGGFPTIVDDETFEEAGRAMRNRRRGAGRPNKKEFNPFQGLVHDALDGCPMYGHTKNGKRWLVSKRALNMETRWKCFSLEAFEEAMRDLLGKLKVHDMVDYPSKANEVAKELTEARLQLAVAVERWKAKPSSNVWADEVDKLEDHIRELETQLEAAKVPVVKLDTKQKDPKKLNAALRRVVESIHLVVLPRNGQSLCVAQVRFKYTTNTQLYIIVWTQSRGGPYHSTPSAVEYRVFDLDTPDMDLRVPEQAKDFAERWRESIS